MHRRQSRLGTSLATAALPLALLTGCAGDDPQPRFPEETASSPTEASPEPTEPTPPPAMEGDDEAAAEAFVEYYFATLTYAKETGETRFARRLGLPTCAACRGALDSVDTVWQAGGAYEGGDIEVKEVRLGRLGSVEGVTPFRGIVVVKTTKEVVRGATELNGVYPAATTRLSFSVVRSRDGWHVGEWSQV